VEGREGASCTHEGVALAGLEGEFLLGHGLRVQLGQGVGGAAEGGVERAVGLIQARRRVRLPLTRHRRRSRESIRRGEGGFACVCNLFSPFGTPSKSSLCYYNSPFASIVSSRAQL
jgi:hypothetical protein